MNQNHQEILNIVKSRIKSMVENEGDFTVILYDEIEPIFHEDIIKELETLGYSVYVVEKNITLGTTDIRYNKGDMLISNQSRIIQYLKGLEGISL